jgi:hypothetical protein
MKLTLNIKKKHFYVLVTLMTLLIGIVAVNAYGTSQPTEFGHSSGEIDVSFDGGATHITLQEAINQGKLGAKEETVFLSTPSSQDLIGPTVNSDTQVLDISSVPSDATEILLHMTSVGNQGDCNVHFEIRFPGAGWFRIANRVWPTNDDTVWLPMHNYEMRLAFDGNNRCNGHTNILAYKKIVPAS